MKKGSRRHCPHGFASLFSFPCALKRNEKPTASRRRPSRAAVAAARWFGKGDKHAADAAAVDAMRYCLSGVAFSGKVVIGEGEKDAAPMLYNGEIVGTGAPPSVDIAVDPLDGTTLVAGGRPGAIACIAIAEKGALYDPGAVGLTSDHPPSRASRE